MAKFNQDLKVWQSQKVPYPHPSDTFFGEILIETCDETPDRVLQFHQEENKALTCRELKNSSISIARNLMKLGIEVDQVVAIICRNSNFITCFINGCVLMGAIIHPLSHQLSADNVKQLLTQTKPQLIVCDPDMLVTVKSAVEFLNDPIVFITSHESAFKLLQSDSDDDVFVAPKFAKRANEKLIAILCSSGTTGHQKGVCVTHAVCLRFNFKAMPPRPPSRPFTFSDAYWSSGFFLHLFIAFYPSEFRIWSNENFNVEKMIEIVEKQKISTCTIPPSSLAALLRSEKFLACDHESLKSFMIIGSLFTETLREKFRQTFPNKILLTSYGMTEIFVSLTKINECYKGTAVGSLIMQNLTIKIVDEDGKKLGVNEQGEIYVKTQFDFPVRNCK
jgi:4-coumarate--CoA ligase